MKIINFWLLKDKKERFKISFKKSLIATLITIGFITFSCVVLTNFSKTATHISKYSLLPILEQKQTPVVKGVIATQSPSVPGEPIKWQMIVPASAILAGQHLVELPKSAQQIKITPINVGAITSTSTKVLASKKILKKTKLGSSSDLTKQDRLKLSELSKQTSRSSESLVLAQTLNKQNKDNVNDILAQGHLAGFFTKVWNLFVSVGSTMTASAEVVIQGTPPQPDTLVVDISPQSQEQQQNDLLSETQTVTQSTVLDITTTPESLSSTTSINMDLVGTSTPTSTESDNVVDTNSTNTNTFTTTTNTNTEHATNTANTNSDIATQSTTTLTENTDVLIEYQTPAPTIAEVPTDTGKIVTVSDNAGEAEGQTHTTNVLAFTNIPEIYKVGQENKIKIKWLNNNGEEMPFNTYDLDGDGRLDYVEWTVPHLSTQIFEIIFITKALEMDESGEIIGDIYDQVKNQDNTWVSITDGHTVRVTFEKFLTNKNDITIFAKSLQAGANLAQTNVDGINTNPIFTKIDVYPVYEGIANEKSVSTFENIGTEKMYKILLTNLPHSTDTFDLKVKGSVVIDYIVDPTPITVTDTFHNTSKIASSNNVVIDTTNGLITLAASSSWACGSALVDGRDGKTYTTVLIGAQCWIQQNLNIGTMVLGSATQGTSSVSIQKYCYSNDASQCISGGGLYQWDQAMAGTTTAGAKGICPVGWHIPTHDQFTTLERATCYSNGTASSTCDTNFPYDTITTGWKGTNEGTTLKNMSGLYRGVLAGYRNPDGSFSYGGTNTFFWSSVASGTSAWRRYLNSGVTGVDRYLNAKAYGFSVRCLKD